MGPIDPEFFTSDAMRAALAARDIGTVYRLLGRQGVSQRQIAQLTGQSQSEVSEIIKGRRVRDVWVLERIADGLGVPRAGMGLSYGEQSPSAGMEISGAGKRRVLVASASTAAMGQVFVDPPELALPTGQPLPARLEMAHVHIVVAVTERLRGVARYYGGQAEVFSAVATLYTQWMQVPATDVVTARLAAALAELHTEAGWCAYDSGLDGTGFFTHALRLAGTARDTYGIANTAWHAGMTLVRTGHPNDALKLFQLGGFSSGRVPMTRGCRPSPRGWPGPPRPPTPPWVATMRQPGASRRRTTDGRPATRSSVRAPTWEPPGLGQLDAAERFAASAARTYGGDHYRRGHTVAELLLAEIHVRAGDPQGVTLAHQAIEKVRTLKSIAARRDWLIPLATALQARPGADTQELARTARQIATTG
ncbi:MAG: helix-turn-helix domain-containing protein [Pseudonocardiaceae bacterium]